MSMIFKPAVNNTWIRAQFKVLSEKLSSLDFSSKDLKLIFFKGISALFPALKIGLREGLYMLKNKKSLQRWSGLNLPVLLQ